MEVLATPVAASPVAAAPVAAAPKEPVATCYICYEDETPSDPYVEPSPCSCTGSIKLHVSCFKEINRRSNTCGICKSKYEVHDIALAYSETLADGYRIEGKRMQISRVLVGEIRHYYPSGSKYIVEQRLPNGLLHGKYKEYHENGIHRRIGYYKNGEMYGPWATYYETGLTKSVIEYDEDEYHGTYIEYFEDGSVNVRCKYDNGCRDGEYVQFYENGDYYRKISYENGHLHGSAIYYYPSGDIEESVQYDLGELHGSARYYYDGGILEREITYRRDTPIDETRYNEDGEIRYFRNYINGQIATFAPKKKKSK